MPEYEVGSLYALIGVDNKPFMAGMAQSQAAMDATAKKMSATAAKTQASTDLSMRKVAKGMTRVGASMSKWVTLPVLAAGLASAKFAVDFQKQMEMVRTQAGASQAEVDKMSQAILKLAASGKVSQGPDELAKGLFHLESVGLRGAKALDALHVAALGASVGGSDLESTASALAGVIITGIKGTHDYSKAMGILNATVGAGNMRMQDLVDALKSGIAPVAKTAGLDLRSLAAGLAMMTDEGVPAGTAANRLRTAIFMLTNPTKKAQGALKDIGLTTTSLGHDLRKPDGLMVAMADLQKHLQKIHDPTKRLAALGNMFGGSRSAGTIAMLLNNLGRLSVKYDQIGRTAGNFSKDVLKTQETASFKLKAAWAQLQAAMVRVGAVVVPIFASIAQKVASAATAFSNLSSGAQGAVLVIAGIAAAAGPVVYVLGSLIKLYQGLAAAAAFAGRAMGIANAEGAAGGAAGAFTKAGTPLTDLRVAAASEEAGMAGVGTAAAGLAGPMTLLAGIVGIVGLAMVKGGGDTDVLSGAYRRAQAAIGGVVPALNNLKNAETGAKDAQLQHRQAQLSVAAAQQQVNALTKAGQKGTLAYKQAVLNVAAAQQQDRVAAAGDQLAKQHLHQQTEATTKALKANRAAFNEVTAAAHKHIAAVTQDSSRQLRGTGLLKNFGDAANSASSIVSNYAGKMDALAQKYSAASAKAASSNPVLAANEKHMAAVARAAANVARQINAIPTSKQIQINILVNREGANLGGHHGGGGTPTNPHGATGAIVTRPTNALIGEKGPEAVVPLNRVSGASRLPGGNLGAMLMGSMAKGAKAAAGAAEFERIVRQILDRMRSAIGKYGPRIVQEFKNLAQQITDAFDRQTQKMQTALDKQLNGMTQAGKELAALQSAHDEAARQQAITDARAALALATAQGDPAAILQAQQQLNDALYAEQVANLEKLDQAEQKARARKVAAEKAALAKRRAELRRHIEKVLKQLKDAEVRAAAIKKAEHEKPGKQRDKDLAAARKLDAKGPHNIKALERLLKELLGAGGKKKTSGPGKSGGKGHPHVTVAPGAVVAIGKNNRELQDLITGAVIAAARRNPQIFGGLAS